LSTCILSAGPLCLILFFPRPVGAEVPRALPRFGGTCPPPICFRHTKQNLPIDEYDGENRRGRRENRRITSTAPPRRLRRKQDGQRDAVSWGCGGVAAVVCIAWGSSIYEKNREGGGFLLVIAAIIAAFIGRWLWLLQQQWGSSITGGAPVIRVASLLSTRRSTWWG
jgi:hypothetical protein